jgi:hypothetical protein
MKLTPELLHSEIISESDIAGMSDRELVEYVGSRIVKFAIEIRPLVVEVHKRFMAEKEAGRKFFGYSNFDTFCEDFWKYSGRQIRNIINGTPTPKRIGGSTEDARSWVQRLHDSGFVAKCGHDDPVLLGLVLAQAMRLDDGDDKSLRAAAELEGEIKGHICLPLREQIDGQEQNEDW